MITAKKDILQGWKDIAAYVSRDVRTVKRWEKQRGLPVRRMPGEGRANVYALIPELDHWLSAGGSVESEAEAAAEPDLDLDAEDAPTPALADPQAPPQPQPLQTSPAFAQVFTRRLMMATTAAVLLILVIAITAAAFTFRAHRREQPAADVPPFSPTQTAREVKYNSKQPGVDALYLRGIYFYEQRTPETLDRALKCFQEAIAKDPGYAPAYSGLAQAYNLVREYSMMPQGEAYAKAKEAARHAIALDPNLPESHASLGFIEFFWDWDAASAEREFHTAITLDPNCVLCHHWYGSMLTHQGRFNESLAQLDIAQRLQPTSISVLSDRAFALGLSGHRNEAADILQEVINEDPTSPSPHRILAIISLLEPRDIPRFLDGMRRFTTLRHDQEGLHMLDLLDAAYRSGGPRAMWQAQLDEEIRLHPHELVYAKASAEAQLGYKEAALRDFELLAAQRDPDVIGLVIDPSTVSLRDDPRFIALARKANLTLSH